MAIHQVVAGAAPGDAVTGAALRLRGLLRRIGPSDVYAGLVDPALAGEVWSVDEYEARAGTGAGDVLVYHAAVGEPAVAAFLQRRPEPLVLLYHDITPAAFFAALDPPLAHRLAGGRAEVAGLRRRVVLPLAVSGSSAAGLEALGYRDVRVSPLPLELSALRELEPDPATVERLAHEADGRPVVLFVGPLLPHKRPDLLLSAFHVLCTYRVPEAHLVLVGAGPLPGFRRALEGVIDELGLDAHITGWVSKAELMAYYRGATGFVTLSEHEGVCAPLLEAMALDVPVTARAHAAIPETVGDAGLLLPPGDDPLLAAEAMGDLVSDGGLRGELIARGRQRVADFDPDVAEATFLGHLADVL